MLDKTYGHHFWIDGNKITCYIFILIKRIRNTTNGLSSLSLYSKQFIHIKPSTIHIGVSEDMISRDMVAFTMALRQFS